MNTYDISESEPEPESQESIPEPEPEQEKKINYMGKTLKPFNPSDI